MRPIGIRGEARKVDKRSTFFTRASTFVTEGAGSDVVVPVAAFAGATQGNDWRTREALFAGGRRTAAGVEGGSYTISSATA